jgi:hypothetical protein
MVEHSRFRATPNNGKPYIGQKVHLNDYGLQMIFGQTKGLSHMKTLVIKIINVGPRIPLDNAECYSVEIDNPDISQFLFDSGCFDTI